MVKAYNMEAEVGSRFRRVAGRYFGFWMRMVRAAELPGPIIETFGAIGVAIVFLIIARETKAPMKAGDFISFVGSLFLLYQPIKLLTRLQGDLQRARLGRRPHLRAAEHPAHRRGPCFTKAAGGGGRGHRV
jgi:subfamily B ATP-binding cassette protein MsbA